MVPFIASNRAGMKNAGFSELRMIYGVAVNQRGHITVTPLTLNSFLRYLYASSLRFFLNTTAPRTRPAATIMPIPTNTVRSVCSPVEGMLEACFTL